MSVTTPIWDRQLVLVTGKGGVGKTTLSASLALAAHQSGRRVLVAEVTPDLHTTSPVLTHFGHAKFRGDSPVEMVKGLWGIRIAPQTGHRQFLRAALKVKLIVDAAMRSAALTRFLMAAPTFPEVGILFQIVALLRSQAYDHMVIDLPATGHALALATLPKTVNRIVPSGLIGDAIREGLECLTDPKRCWAVLPTLPESMPVTETVELIAALSAADIRVGAVVLNRMPDDPFTDAERAALRAHLHDHTFGRVLGGRELIRLDRALAAREAFHRDVPAGIARYVIPTLEAESERARVDRIVAHLAAPGVT